MKYYWLKLHIIWHYTQINPNTRLKHCLMLSLPCINLLLINDITSFTQFSQYSIFYSHLPYRKTSRINVFYFYKYSFSCNLFWFLAHAAN